MANIELPIHLLNQYIEYCKVGNIDMIQNMELMNCVDNEGFHIDITGFRIACEMGHLNIVHYLTQIYKSLPEGRMKPHYIHIFWEEGFRLACTYGHLDIVHYLIELYKNDANYKKIDIHARCDNAFRLACMNGHYDIVRYLIELYKTNNDYTKININSINDYNRIISASYPQRKDGFIVAYKNKHNSIVKYLINLHKYDKNYDLIETYLVMYEKLNKYNL